MIELETMLMQFCLETSGRLNGDRYPVGKGRVSGRRCAVTCAELAEGRDSGAVRRVILCQRPAAPWFPVTVLHGDSIC
jgi:hypothetical protein